MATRSRRRPDLERSGRGDNENKTRKKETGERGGGGGGGGGGGRVGGSEGDAVKAGRKRDEMVEGAGEKDGGEKEEAKERKSMGGGGQGNRRRGGADREVERGAGGKVGGVF